MEAAALMIDLRRVTKTYGEGETRVTALRELDLTIADGEFVSIMGPSGSGKSTLLHLISALDTPSAGEIYLDGQPTHALSDDALTQLRREKVGLIFQFFNLLPTLNAFDNVLLPVLMERRDSSEDRARAEALLAEVGLAQRLQHRMHQLSGGEMQRVAIARALMLRPRLLLADEPTGNLDSQSGAKILALLRDTCVRHGTTIVMVTHDPGAALQADRRISLKDGRIVADARTDDVQQ